MSRSPATRSGTGGAHGEGQGRRGNVQHDQLDGWPLHPACRPLHRRLHRRGEGCRSLHQDPGRLLAIVYRRDGGQGDRPEPDLARRDRSCSRSPAGAGSATCRQRWTRGVYGIGVDADQNYVAPSTIITSAIKKVNVAVFQTIQGLLNSTFKGGDNEFTLQNKATGFAPPNSAVPASIVSQVQQIEQEIASGQITPPATIPSNCTSGC